MAKWLSSFMLLFVALVAHVHMTCAARDMPKNGLNDQKNVVNFGGMGSYSGVGNNGLPFGGVGGGVGSGSDIGGMTGLAGVGGGIGTLPSAGGGLPAFGTGIRGGIGTLPSGGVGGGLPGVGGAGGGLPAVGGGGLPTVGAGGGYPAAGGAVGFPATEASSTGGLPFP